MLSATSLQRATLGLALLLHTALTAFGIWTKSFSLGGDRWFLLGDDAMISMRYARNLADGHGLVWNAGERVEGFTNPLWTLFMVVPHLLPIPYFQTSLFMQLLNLVLGLAVVVLAGRLALAIAPGAPTAAPFAALAVAVYLPLIFWGVEGFETSLLAVLVTAAWTDIVRKEASPTRPFLLLTAACLTRPDAILLFIPAILSYLLARRTKGLIFALSLAFVSLLCAEAARLAYYDELLPNTYYLKAQFEPRFGLGYLRLFMLYGGGFLAVILVAASLLARSRDGLLLTAAFGLVATYTVAIGGDVFYFGRFFVPIMPAVIAATVVLSLTAIQSNRLTTGVRYDGLLASAMTAGLVVAVLLGNYWVMRDVGRHLVHGTYRNWWIDEKNAEIGLFLRQNAPSAKIAVFYAGTTPYVSMSPTVDFLGKSDPAIAHHDTVQGKVPGHNKFDFDYSLAQQPEIIVAHLSLDELNDPPRLDVIARGHFGYRALILRNQAFQTHYAANRLDVPLQWMLFLRDDSPLLGALPVASTPQ